MDNLTLMSSEDDMLRQIDFGDIISDFATTPKLVKSQISFNTLRDSVSVCVWLIFSHLVSSKSKDYSHGTKGFHMALRTRAFTHQNPALSSRTRYFSHKNHAICWYRLLRIYFRRRLTTWAVFAIIKTQRHWYDERLRWSKTKAVTAFYCAAVTQTPQEGDAFPWCVHCPLNHSRDCDSWRNMRNNLKLDNFVFLITRAVIIIENSGITAHVISFYIVRQMVKDV